MAETTPDSSPTRVQLMAPGAWPSVPVKSKISLSPALVMARRMR
jgi:hypothetical protein